MAPSRRAPAGTATPSSEVDRVLTSHSLDLRAARSRVELVAEALELPFAEVESAMADPEGHSLLAFACQYGQNIDWLVRRSEWRGARMLATAWRGTGHATTGLTSSRMILHRAIVFDAVLRRCERFRVGGAEPGESPVRIGCGPAR